MFQPGQHVVLVDDRWGPRFFARCQQLLITLPVKGVVYTVRDIDNNAPDGSIHIRLAEIINKPILSRFLRREVEPCFMIERFRPLRKLSTEQFTAGLTPLDQFDLLREYAGS